MAGMSGIAGDRGVEVDLDLSMLILEVVRGESRLEADLMATFVLVHGICREIASAGCREFFDRPGALVDVEAVLASVGIDPGEGVARVMWTDETADLIRSAHQHEVLHELRPAARLDEAVWSAHVAVTCRIVARMGAWTLSAAEFDGLDPSILEVATMREARACAEGIVAGEIAAARAAGPCRPYAHGGLHLISVLATAPEPGASDSVADALVVPLALRGPADPGAAFAELRMTCPWMAPAIDPVEERVLTMAALGRPWARFDPILVHGPPGCGKSHFAGALAKALDVRIERLSLSGSRDGALIDGVSRAWRNTSCSLPVRSMARTRSANPLLFVDEVDKARSSVNGDALSSMLPMIERSTSSRLRDLSLDAEVDASHCLWLLAANQVQDLPGALVDRMLVVRVEAPGPEHAEVVLEGMRASLARSFGIGVEDLPDHDAHVVARVADEMRRSRSLRGLARIHEEWMRRRLGVILPSRAEASPRARGPVVTVDFGRRPSGDRS